MTPFEFCISGVLALLLISVSHGFDTLVSAIKELTKAISERGL